MKKFLLTLAGVAALSFVANAETYTLNVDDATEIDGTFTEETTKGTQVTAAHYQPLNSLNLGGFQFEFTTTNTSATSAPAYYYATSTNANQQKTIRIYKQTTMVITAPNGENMTKINFKGSNGKAGAAYTINNGTLTFASASAATWTGSTNSLSMTATENFRITEIEITTGEGGETPVEPGTPNVIYTLLAQSNTELPEGWTLDNVVMPEEASYIWSWKTYNGAGYLNASAYVAGAAYASEAYAVSPVIDLTKVTKATAEFEHAAKFQTTLTDLCGLCVREEGATAWTALTIPTWPTADTWTFASSGSIDLSAYDGKKIQLAFKYGSSANGADTWEVKNLVISGEGEGQAPTTPVVETTNYTLATAIENGTYLFAIDGQAGANIAESTSYGRFNMTTVNVTVAGNTITAPTAYGVKIEKADEGYTLTDCFGRYLGMDDEHLTSFQIYTSLNEGCFWTIVIESDGTANIVNVLTECTISQTKGTSGTFFTNIAPANLNGLDAADFNLPKLYAGSASSAVEAVEAADNAVVEYFNLQGIRVENPANGLYIRRQGNNVTKVLVK